MRIIQHNSILNPLAAGAAIALFLGGPFPFAHAQLADIEMSNQRSRTTETAQSGPSWRAGTARANITPERAMWMAGYGMRTRPTEEVLADIWAKALAIEDPEGNLSILLTADLCGVSGTLSSNVARELHERHGLPREAIMVAVSHTHASPLVEGYLEGLSGTLEMPEEDRQAVQEYTRRLEETLVRMASEAIDDLEATELAWGTGEADFAVNRRNNSTRQVNERRERGEPLEGPVDHTVPVLKATRADGSPKAILTAYACHATVLADYEFSGDWPGFAQTEIEEDFPGATAFFVAGCGGDANPLPRRSVELAKGYGRDLADAVKETIEAGLRPLEGSLAFEYTELELPFEDVPDIEHFREIHAEAEEAAAQGENLMERPGFQRAQILRARVMLRDHGDKNEIPDTYPYPIQVWNLGSELTWVSLAGEVTSGYALRLREKLGEDRTWVTAYANDVMGYIPTRTVWEEGGYEGDTSSVYYALPSRWAGNVEELIVSEVHRLVREAPVGSD